MSQVASPTAKVFLGYGKSKDYRAYPGHVLMEEGRRVYAVPKDFFCDQCEAAGCKRCKWTGENIKYRQPRPQQELRVPKKGSKSQSQQDGTTPF
jgi:hypothetical protein